MRYACFNCSLVCVHMHQRFVSGSGSARSTQKLCQVDSNAGILHRLGYPGLAARSGVWGRLVLKVWGCLSGGTSEGAMTVSRFDDQRYRARLRGFPDIGAPLNGCRV